MKVLIIEDVEFRQNYLSKLIEADEIDCARRADKALEFLFKNNYDVVFLDHDLIGARSGSNLTMEWAGNLDTIKTKKPIVIIHSMNMDGASKMEIHLKGISKRTERIPFRRIAQGGVDLMEFINKA